MDRDSVAEMSGVGDSSVLEGCKAPSVLPMMDEVFDSSLVSSGGEASPDGVSLLDDLVGVAYPLDGA